MTEGMEDGRRVSLEVDGDGIAILRLSRPEKLNALDHAMFDAILAAGEQLAARTDVRCVILCGQGRGFCAGIDMKVLAAGPGSAPPVPLETRSHGPANRYQQAALQFRTLPVPVIAAIHGVCFGAGLQIAAGADIRIASPDARLSIMEVQWGIVPDMGGYALWRGIVRADQLRLLSFSAAEVAGTAAQQLGLVTQLADDPLSAALELAQRLAGMSPDAIRAAKRLFNQTEMASLPEILALESAEQQRLLGSANQIEAVRSRREGRPGRFL